MNTRADYCFTVASGGVYRLIGWVHAATGYDDSFFVQVDGQPAGGYLWDAQINTSYAADYVNERNGADPVEFSLTPGEHTVSLYLREDGTRLDKLSLELISSAVAAATVDQQPARPLYAVGIAGVIGADELADMRGDSALTVTLADTASRGDTFSATVQLDAQGRFYFDRMPIGEYRLMLNLPDDSTYGGSNTFTLTAARQKLTHFVLGTTVQYRYQLYLPLLTR